MDNQNLLLWRDFERDLKTLKRSPRTIQSYNEAATQLLAFAAGQWCADLDEPCEHTHTPDPYLADLEKVDIQEYLLTVIDRHSDETAGNRYRSLRRLYNWMVAEEILDASPMRRIGEPKPEEKLTEVPPIEHVRALLGTCKRKKGAGTRRQFNDIRDEAIIRLFCEPGSPRCGEMASITVANIDLTTDVVSFLGKGAKWRSIPFGNKTGKAMSKYMRERPKHPLVADAKAKDPKASGPELLWLGWRGGPLTGNGIHQMIERRCVEAGIPDIHPHQLRHYATDAWYAAGGSEQDAMHLFGWSSPAMAHHYAKQRAGSRAISTARSRAIGDQL